MKYIKTVYILIPIVIFNFSSCVVKRSNNIGWSQDITINIKNGGTVINGAPYQKITIGSNTNILASTPINSNDSAISKSQDSSLECSKYNTDIVSYAERKDIKGIKCALQNGANINAKDKNGWTALMETSLNGYFDTGIDRMIYLLSREPDIEIKNNRGETALIIASYHTNPNMVKLLLLKNADKRVKNNKGETACDVAGESEKSQKQRQKILDLLGSCK